MFGQPNYKQRHFLDPFRPATGLAARTWTSVALRLDARGLDDRTWWTCPLVFLSVRFVCFSSCAGRRSVRSGAAGQAVRSLDFIAQRWAPVQGIPRGVLALDDGRTVPHRP